MQKETNFAKLDARCREILTENGRMSSTGEFYTVPTGELYPFQWLWDSGFIAIGLSYIDMNKARQEMATILASQWTNGMLPHIIFHDDTPDKNYFPSADFHGASSSIHSTKHIKTSGITQPPVIGFVLEYLWNKETNPNDHFDFYRNAVQKTFEFHEYLYRDRDPHQEGLVYIRHNWEAGTDNNAAWDSVWASYTAPEYELKRKDTSVVSSEQRPTKKDYNYYAHLLKLSIECKYDEALMYEKLPFIVQDPLFNTLLVASNNGLIYLAEKLDLPEIAHQCRTWNEKTIARMNEKLWDDQQKTYVYYDLKKETIISTPGSPGMSPLFAGIPTPEQAIAMKEMLESPVYLGENDSAFLASTLTLTHPEFDDRRYWRGPVWININWLLFKGSLQYGFVDLAKKLKEDSISLVERYGAYEYFSPLKSAIKDPDAKGFGGSNFSWTMALILDMLHQKI